MKQSCMLLVLLFILCGCAPQQAPNNPVTFYYPAAEKSQEVLSSVVVEASGLSSQQLMNAYFTGSHASNECRVFPEEIAAAQISVKGASLSVSFPDDISHYPPSQVTLWLACITATLCPITGAKEIQFRCDKAPLLGQEELVMTPEHIVFSDMRN